MALKMEVLLGFSEFVVNIGDNMTILIFDDDDDDDV